MSAGPTNPEKADSIYDFSAEDIDGNLVSLKKYEGHVCIIVNVASKWGKTDVNYKQLTQLYNQYKEVGEATKISTHISKHFEPQSFLD